MFKKIIDEKDGQIEKRLKEIEHCLNVLIANQRIMIKPPSHRFDLLYGDYDEYYTNPSEAINLILKHLGLEFHRKKAVPSILVLQQKEELYNIKREANDQNQD